MMGIHWLEGMKSHMLSFLPLISNGLLHVSSVLLENIRMCFAGEVITCLENAESLQSVDLNELSVTLDIFVLTLPLEIEVMTPDCRHNRSVMVKRKASNSVAPARVILNLPCACPVGTRLRAACL